VVVAINKIDLPARVDRATRELVARHPSFEVSALDGRGVEVLVRRLVSGDAAGADLEAPVLACVRHRDLVSSAVEDIDGTGRAIGDGMPADVVASALRSAIRNLDELTGREVVPDVLDAIFSRFCVGK
jgi:tRNA modification GTPase